MRTGWWKVRFDVMLDGIEIDFDELPKEEKHRVQKLLANGVVAGEIELEDDPSVGAKVALNYGGYGGKIIDVKRWPGRDDMYLIERDDGYKDWFYARQFKLAE